MANCPDRGAAIIYRSPGVYEVRGDPEIGPVMALEAVEEAVRAWCRRVTDADR